MSESSLERRQWEARERNFLTDYVEKIKRHVDEDKFLAAQQGDNTKNLFRHKSAAARSLEKICRLLFETRYSTLANQFDDGTLTWDRVKDLIERLENIDLILKQLFHRSINLLDFVNTLIVKEEEDHAKETDLDKIKEFDALAFEVVKKLFLEWKGVDDMPFVHQLAKKVDVEVPSFRRPDLWGGNLRVYREMRDLAYANAKAVTDKWKKWEKELEEEEAKKK
ncbi:uncharacterized protein BDZ83DRAFT_658583 [Colletotrichum acutatum]|uniref:Uncharacterized protein n=1 Tax=Glomerella acutata TaxID=27357 RepID=A0AAD8U8S3_GLOAC|nr:uncharacterized protein BDZ83DRAFT_658583 [Colletotrichum acutatum]KAK1701660.1 hypothetical protein BDZ83DRAFT_658583 [Colletotrichum acutatum]